MNIFFPRCMAGGEGEEPVRERNFMLPFGLHHQE